MPDMSALSVGGGLAPEGPADGMPPVPASTTAAPPPAFDAPLCAATPAPVDSPNTSPHKSTAPFLGAAPLVGFGFGASRPTSISNGCAVPWKP
eukprot:9468242-Pyramimonas_sp.AAC.3